MSVVGPKCRGMRGYLILLCEPVGHLDALYGSAGGHAAVCIACGCELVCVCVCILRHASNADLRAQCTGRKPVSWNMPRDGMPYIRPVCLPQQGDENPEGTRFAWRKTVCYNVEADLGLLRTTCNPWRQPSGLKACCQWVEQIVLATGYVAVPGDCK